MFDAALARLDHVHVWGGARPSVAAIQNLWRRSFGTIGDVAPLAPRCVAAFDHSKFQAALARHRVDHVWGTLPEIATIRNLWSSSLWRRSFDTISDRWYPNTISDRWYPNTISDRWYPNTLLPVAIEAFLTCTRIATFRVRTFGVISTIVAGGACAFVQVRAGKRGKTSQLETLIYHILRRRGHSFVGATH